MVALPWLTQAEVISILTGEPTEAPLKANVNAVWPYADRLGAAEMKLFNVTLLARISKPCSATSSTPATVALALISSAPATEELAGLSVAVARPSELVNAVATLVRASPLTTEKVTTCPASLLSLASFSVARTTVGLAESMALESRDRLRMGDLTAELVGVN